MHIYYIYYKNVLVRIIMLNISKFKLKALNDIMIFDTLVLNRGLQGSQLQKCHQK